MRIPSRLSMVLIGLLPSITASAAPFCMNIPGATSQCIYYDGAQCQRDSARQNGSCDPNPSEIRPTKTGLGTFCMITPDGAQRCGYGDGTVCSREAILQKGVCAKAEGTGPKVRPDDYNINANR